MLEFIKTWRSKNYLFYYTSVMIENFDYKKVEELYKNGELDEAKLEEITWKLEMNVEKKAFDEENDLVTVIRTANSDLQEVIQYVRRTTKEENDAFEFTIVIGKEEAEATTTEPTNTTEPVDEDEAE